MTDEAFYELLLAKLIEFRQRRVKADVIVLTRIAEDGELAEFTETDHLRIRFHGIG